MATEHPRQRIRAAVKAQLIGEEPDFRTCAEDRIDTSRMVRWKPTQLPAIAIYALTESVDDDAAPRELKRTVDLAIEAAVRADESVDDRLDAIAGEIERAMHGDDTLAGSAGDSVLRSTELLIFEDGDQLIGLVRLVYGVTYFSYAPDAADQVLDDLTTADTTYDLGGAQEAPNQAEDTVENLDT